MKIKKNVLKHNFWHLNDLKSRLIVVVPKKQCYLLLIILQNAHMQLGHCHI